MPRLPDPGEPGDAVSTLRALATTVIGTGLVAGLLGGCGVHDGEQAQDPAGLDRSGQITGVADGLYEAMGVADSRVAFAYERRPSSSCATALGLEPGLDAGQAWYARQAFALSPGTYDADRCSPGAAGHFTDGGWQTTYRRKGLRALRAVHGDVGVLVVAPGVDVTVTVGPCGQQLTGVDGTWTADPG